MKQQTNEMQQDLLDLTAIKSELTGQARERDEELIQGIIEKKVQPNLRTYIISFSVFKKSIVH